MSNCYLKEVCNRFQNRACLNDCPCYEPDSYPVGEDTRKEYVCQKCGFEWKTCESENKVFCACGQKMVLKEFQDLPF